MMSDWNHLWINARLVTMTTGQGEYGLIENGAIAVTGERISWLGPMDDLPADVRHKTPDVVDVKGRCITPGLIDCHTHLVFGGNRAREFELRLKGATYEELLQAGGLSRFRAVNITTKSLVAAPCRIIPEKVADVRFGTGRADVSPVSDEALPVFQPPELFNGTHGDIAVRTDAEFSPVSQKLLKPENTVSQVGFSGGTEADDSVTRGQFINLPTRQVSCVNKTPAPVDIDIFE